MAKILLVEDDNNLREIYQARLVAEGYDIVAAQNGEEALVVAKQNKPDLIISDVMMPRISGFEMLDILRNTDELKHTKVIMLTALGQAEDQKRAGNLGADRYLVKSQVTLEDIVNAAKELLAESGADMPAEPAAPEATPAPETASVATAEPVAPAPETASSAPVVPEPVATAPEPAPVVPAPAADPIAPEPAVPASVVPQADTTVVVPPAPANPEPPSVTTVAMPPEPAADPAGATTPASEPAPAPETASSAPLVEAPESTPAAAETAVADAATQTLEKEEAELQSQIDSYAKTPAEPALAVEPALAAAAADASASNEETLADAVEELNSPPPEAPLQPPSVTNAPAAPAATPKVVAPAPEQVVLAPAEAPAAAPAAGTAPATSDNVTVAGKKVIQPLNAIEKPNLDALLAKEEAATPAPAPTPTVNGQAAAPAPPTPPNGAVPGQSFDPNTAL